MIAVVTAGGTVDAAFAAEIGTRVKALAPLRSGRLIDPAIDAARACGARRIVVVGDDAVAAHCGARVDDVIPASADGRASLETALRLGAPGEPLLLSTSDLPFVTAAALGDLLARAGDAELAMPLAAGDAYAAAYPGAADHVTALGAERVANGGVFLFASAETAVRAIAIARRLFAARKSLLALATVLDLPLVARFATRRLRIAHLEAYARTKFGLHARAVRDASPALCYDVDALRDYRYALAHGA